MNNAPAAGGGHWVQVAPERFERWCAGFAQRHGGPLVVTATPELLGIAAIDGATADCHVPFPPLAFVPDAAATSDLAALGSVALDGAASDSAIAAVAAHAAVDRRIAVLMVRRGGFAIGLFDGPRLLESKVGARHVQGRTKAGGWSQKRFARRREGQAREAYAAAADHTARLLLPHLAEIEALATGGDAGAIAALRTDPRLGPLFAREAGPLLSVGDPRAADLRDAPRAFRAVRIRVVEPAAPDA